MATTSGKKPKFVKAGYWLAENANTIPATSMIISSTQGGLHVDLFTHIFCGYVDVDPVTKSMIISPTLQSHISNFSADLKQKTSSIKTLLSIGGKSALSQKGIALMAALKSRRKAFIESSITLARQYNFDGLDLHWLYPSNQFEMKNFGTLLHEWRDAIKVESQQQEKAQLLLVSSVFYSPYNPNSDLYPINEMKHNLDWINVLAYDFYTTDSSSSETGPSACFLNSKTRSLSGNFGIEQWISKNYPSHSIVLGLPFSGWAWHLRDANQYRPFSPASGPAPSISNNGRINYGKIKEVTQTYNAKTDFDSKDIFNYAYYDTNWISYDDEQSIIAKITEAKKFNLLGYYASEIGADDAYSTLAIIASQQWDAYHLSTP